MKMKAACNSFIFLSILLCLRSCCFCAPQRSDRATLSSDNFRISYPARASRRDAEEALGTLESVRSDMLIRLSAAGLNAPALADVSVYVFETSGDFVGATGQPPWVSAVTRKRNIQIQPLSTLRRRGVFVTTIRHEYIHIVAEVIGHGRVPRSLSEGLAIYISGEGVRYGQRTRAATMDFDELDRRLENAGSPQEMRDLYQSAYRRLMALITAQGEANVLRQLASY